LTTLKEQLHALCLAYANQRIETAQKAIAIAQASANEEIKSSTGDKYETGRAMMQLEVEQNTTQLAEASKLKAILLQIKTDQVTDSIQNGSIVHTNQGNYYIAISAGQLKADNKTWYAISAASPIGSKLMGLKKDDQFTHNGKTYHILHVE
jgi:transcription elongation GreA/GreB family factor